MNDDKPLTIKTINSGTLKKIISWCTYHKDDPIAPEDDDNRHKQSTEEVSSWDDKFLQEEGQAALFDLISVRCVVRSNIKYYRLMNGFLHICLAYYI